MTAIRRSLGVTTFPQQTFTTWRLSAWSARIRLSAPFFLLELLQAPGIGDLHIGVP